MSTTDETVEGGERSAASWLGSIRSVVLGGAFNILGTAFVSALSFLVTYLLTGALGASLYGVYTYGTRIVITIQKFANLGTDVSSMKYLSANRDDSRFQGQIFGLSTATAVASSTLAGAALYVGAPTLDAWTLDTPRFVPVIRVLAVALPFHALTQIILSSFRGLEDPKYQTLIQVAQSATRLATFAAVIWAGYSLGGVVAGFVVASVLVFAFAALLFASKTDVRPRRGLSTGQVASFYNFSLPFTVSRGGTILYKRTDIFMLGFLLSTEAVGVYNVALLLGIVTTMPLAALNQLFPSVASRLYSNDEYDVLESVYRTVTRWSITVSLVTALPLLVYRDVLMGLFGAEFVAGAAALGLLVVGQLINAASGPSNDLLTMTDHQYLVSANSWVFGLSNVALNYYFIQAMGLVGAAVGTAAVLALINAARVVEVWYLEGLFPYSRAFWKPAVAGVGTAAAMLACRLLADGLLLVVVGGLVGVLTYAGLLYAFGAEEQDVRLARTYLSSGE